MSPWRPEDRGTSDTYNAEYRRNAAICKRNAHGRCARCGKLTRQLQADHIRPVSQGGSHSLSNLQALCQPCHRAKTAREGSGARRNQPPADPPARPATHW